MELRIYTGNLISDAASYVSLRVDLLDFVVRVLRVLINEATILYSCVT